MRERHDAHSTEFSGRSTRPIRALCAGAAFHSGLRLFSGKCAAAGSRNRGGGLLAWLIVESPHGKPLPKIIINTVVVCATIFLWGELQNGDRNFVAALGHFITVLLLCKFFERKDARDLYQIVVLSLLLIVASAMYSSSIIFAIVLAAYAALLVYLHDPIPNAGQPRSGRTSPATADRPARAQLHFYGRYPEGRIPLHASAGADRDCGLPFAPANARQFRLFPLGLGRWNLLKPASAKSIQFHDYGQLAQSDEVVMEVKLTRHGENAGSEWFEPYFRGQVLDTYNAQSKQWRLSPAYPQSDDAPPDRAQLLFTQGEGVVVPQESYNPNLIIQEYTLYHTVGRTLSNWLLRSISRLTICPASGLTGEMSPSLPWGDAATVQYTVASLPTFDSTLLAAPAAAMSAMTIPRKSQPWHAASCGMFSSPPDNNLRLNKYASWSKNSKIISAPIIPIRLNSSSRMPRWIRPSIFFSIARRPAAIANISLPPWSCSAVRPGSMPGSSMDTLASNSIPSAATISCAKKIPTPGRKSTFPGRAGCNPTPRPLLPSPRVPRILSQALGRRNDPVCRECLAGGRGFV